MFTKHLQYLLDEVHICISLFKNKHYIHEFSYLLYYTISSALRKTKFKRVIDVGCGIGIGAAMLKANGLDVVGVDINETLLEQCRKRDLTCEKVNVADYNDVDRLIDVHGLFDVAIMLEVIEHIPLTKALKTLHNLYKLLKYNGILIISTPNKYYYDMYSCTHGHVNELPPKYLLRLLKLTGFKILKVYYSGPVSKVLFKLIYNRKLASRMDGCCSSLNIVKRLEKNLYLALFDRRWLLNSLTKIIEKVGLCSESTLYVVRCKFNLKYYSKITDKEDSSLMYIVIAVKGANYGKGAHCHSESRPLS